MALPLTSINPTASEEQQQIAQKEKKGTRKEGGSKLQQRALKDADKCKEETNDSSSLPPADRIDGGSSGSSGGGGGKAKQRKAKSKSSSKATKTKKG